jgi:hypothetical protein
MDAEEEVTCGQEMATDAEVPEALARLMRHVAGNMETHARWVGAGAEHDALLIVAREYVAIADAAARAARAMQAMRDIPGAPHDPTQLDRGALARWMGEKIEMQLELAQLLTAHAEASTRALDALTSAS